MGLDKFTVDHVVSNIAGTSDPNIFGPFEIIVDPTPLPGDFNFDGTVDAADYTVWRNNLGSATALPNDDTAGAGPDDYDRWKANFGQTAGAGSRAFENAAVPEPATMGLLILAAIGWRFRRGRAA